LIDKVYNSPVEIGLWILFVCLDIGVATLKLRETLEKLFFTFARIEYHGFVEGFLGDTQVINYI
jgi:hypothetical protein